MHTTKHASHRRYSYQTADKIQYLLEDPPAPQDDTDQLVNPLILSKLHTKCGYGHLEYTPF